MRFIITAVSRQKFGLCYGKDIMKTLDREKMNSTEAPVVRYLHAKAARFGSCASVTFEITSRCNFSCKMCYVHSQDCNRRADEELTLEQWTSIADQASEAGVMFVLITGGEPLVRPDFPGIYTMLIKKGFVVSINSNLSLVTDEHLELFKKYPPNRINASLYGVSDETYEALCGVPAYTKVRSTIKKLKEMGIRVKINSSVTPFNCGDFDGIFSFCRAEELPIATASYMFPAARLSAKRERLSPEDAGLYRVIADYKKLDKDEFLDRAERIERGVEYIQSGSCIDPEIKNTGVRCRAGTSSVWIDYKGNMSMCGMIPADEKNNIPLRGFRECFEDVHAFVKKIVLPEKCTECRYRYMCNVCAASCNAETGCFGEVPTYVCRMTECAAEYYKQYANKIKAGELNED